MTVQKTNKNRYKAAFYSKNEDLIYDFPIGNFDGF